MAEPFDSQLSFWSEDDDGSAWAIRASERARRLSVRVFRTGRVEVVVPPRTSRRSLRRFLDQHREWIERKRGEARRHASPAQPFPPTDIELAACEETWRLHLAGGSGRTQIELLPPQVLAIRGNAADAALRRALQRWLNLKAQQTLAPWLAMISHELRLPYTKMLIRRQRTRWGSCSTRGTISLNCCLLFQRPEVVRYLLIHELVHTRHMNHSKRFWRCVAGYCPEFERLDRELRDGWRRVPQWGSSTA